MSTPRRVLIRVSAQRTEALLGQLEREGRFTLSLWPPSLTGTDFDALVLEDVPPELDAVALLEASALDAPPVVVLSSHSQRSLALLEAGASGLLPVGAPGLAQVLERVVRERALEREAERSLFERREAEQQLRESEARLSLALEAGRLGLFDLCYADGRLEANSRLLELFGFAPSERPGALEMAARIHPDDRDAAECAALAARERGEAYRILYRVQRPDGSVLHLRGQGTPQGERIIGFVEDVTEAVQAHEALVRSEAQLQAVLEGLPQPAWMVDADGRVVYRNPAWRAFLGPDVSLGPELNAAVLRWDDSGSVATHLALLRTGQAFEREQLLVRADGVERWHRVRVQPLAGQGLWVGVAQDVHDLKVQAQTLEHHLEAVVNALPVIVFALDAQGTLTLSQGRGLEALGLRPGEAVGQDARTLYAGHPEVLEAIERGLAGETFTSDVQVGGRTLENRYSPIHDEAGEVVGAFGLALDVTERRTLERENVEAVSRATLLSHLSDALSSARTPQAVAEDALSLLGPVLRAEAMFLLLREENGLRLLARWGQVHPLEVAGMASGRVDLARMPLAAPVLERGAARYAANYAQFQPQTPSPQRHLAVGFEPVCTSSGQVLGLLNLRRLPEHGDWTPAERDLVRRAAATVGLALERTEREAQLEEARTRAELLSALADALALERSPEGVFRVAAERLGQALGVRYVSLMRLGGDVLRLAHLWGEMPSQAFERSRAGFLASSGGLLWRATHGEGGAYCVDYPECEDALPGLALEGWAIGAEAVRGADGAVRATLSVGRSSAVGAWRGGERELLARAARTVGLALERAEREAQLEDERTRYAVLAALSDALSSAGTPEAVAEVALDRLGPALRATAMLAVKLEREALLRPQYWGEVPPAVREVMDRPGLRLNEAPALSRVALEGWAQYLDDYHNVSGSLPGLPHMAHAAQPILTPAGRLEGFLVVWRDTAVGAWTVGERSLLERAAAGVGQALERAHTLSQLQQRFDFALEAAEIGLWEWDVASGVQRWSATQRALFGLDPAAPDSSLQGYLELVHPEDRPRVAEAGARQIAPGGPEGFEHEFRILHPEGVRWLYGRGRVERGPDGRAARMSGVNFDITARKRLELERERTAAQLEGVLRGAPLGIALFDRELRYQQLNPRLAEINALPLERHLGRRLSEVLPGLAPQLEGQLRQVLERGAPILNLEVRQPYRHDPARVGVWSQSLYPLRAESGEVLGVTALVEDITERIEAREQLEALLSRFDRAQKAARGWVYEYEFESGEVRRSDGYLEVLGYAPGEIAHSGDAWTALIHPEDLERLSGAVRRILVSERTYALEYRVRHKAGHYLWVEERGELLRDAAGRVVRQVASTVDVTARKEAQAALEASEAFVRSVLESSPDSIAVLDPLGRVLEINAPGLHLMGLIDGSRMDGQPWADLWPPALRGEVQHALNEAAQGGVAHFQGLASVARGQARFWDVAVAPVRAPGGEVLRLVSVARDLTAQHRTLETLRETQESQRRFVNDLAHELRTPLTAIAGNLELMLRYPQMTPEDRQDAVSEAFREAERLGRLTTDLLALARGDAGQTLELRPLELRPLLEEVWREAARLARGHTLELGALEDAPVAGHRDRLKQLALILLDNALKYTPPSGQVRMALERRGAELLLCVRDSGPGIPQADLPRVFERFYRVAHAGDPGGTGLGLPIAQWIARSHGGDIWLESEVGVGTTVWVRLPVLEDEDETLEVGGVPVALD